MSSQLEQIVQESGLETTKAQVILGQFKDYFDIAGEWEEKAKAIVVTDASQTADMEMARVGRLFLREKRIAIEKTRKELKEQSLREGKAIDGLANVLKALIVPTEEYLEKQEKFVELQEKAIRDAKQKEIERRMEEERLAEEKKKAEEFEKTRLENERLRKEAAEKEKAFAAERAEAEAARQKAEREARLERERVAAEKAQFEAKAAAERREIEEKARKAEEAKKKAQANLRAEKKETEAILTDFERLLKFVQRVAGLEWGGDAEDINRLRFEAEQLYNSIIKKEVV